MTLALPSDDQQVLARGVADFLADGFPLDRFRSGGSGDVARWSELAALGIIGLSLPEADGGLGLTIVEEVLVARELGRVLASPALIGAMLAVHVADGERRAAILSGACPVGIALGTLDGEARVADGGGPFLMLDGDTLRLVQAPQRPLECLDATVTLAAAALPGVELAVTHSPRLALAAQLLAAGFLVGQLETTRDMAADYARIRVQFGRPIGAFQAIKHRCADAALGAEMAWAQTWAAAHALAAGQSDAAFQARAAKWLAGDEALKAARFAIQVHGGMGFTQEVDAQLLLKRCHLLHQMFGNPRLVPAQLIQLPVEA